MKAKDQNLIHRIRLFTLPKVHGTDAAGTCNRCSESYYQNFHGHYVRAYINFSIFILKFNMVYYSKFYRIAGKQSMNNETSIDKFIFLPNLAIRVLKIHCKVHHL